MLAAAVAIGTGVALSTVWAQSKPRIAVTAFENKVKQPWGDPSWKIGDGLAEMLTTELMRTGRFIVVERQAAADVIGEQGLGQSGLVRRETAAPTGQMLGAQIVVRGAVTEFADATSGGGAGVQTGRIGIQGQIQNAHVAIDLRLVDTTTGQVLASHSIAKVVPSAGAGLGARVGTVTFGGDAFFQTPIGQATRAAMQEAVQRIMAATGSMAAGSGSFAIVQVEGPRAYINAGSAANVRPGDVYQVYSKGNELIDPDTGLKLGSSERPIGSIQITEVQENFSIGTIQLSTAAIQRGDRVKAP
jgi:curli biogenesis system outer membrane secretion channel CsgG